MKFEYFNKILEPVEGPAICDFDPIHALLSDFFHSEFDENVANLLSSALCGWNYDNWDGSLHQIFILIQHIFEFNRQFSVDSEISIDFSTFMFSQKFELVIQRMIFYWNLHYVYEISWDVLGTAEVFTEISGTVITPEWLANFMVDFGIGDFTPALPDFRKEFSINSKIDIKNFNMNKLGIRKIFEFFQNIYKVKFN